MIVRLLAPGARWYILHVPWAKGKGRLLTWLQTHLGTPPSVFRTTNGFNIEFRPLQGDTTCVRFYLFGTWEPASNRVVERILRLGDTFLDVGGNIGFYALLAAQAVGAEGRVITFEPMTVAHDWLQRNLKLNPALRVDARKSAVGADRGELIIHFVPGTGIGGAGEFVGSDADPGEATTVQAIPLDDLLREEDLGPHIMLKVDIEGGERNVFRGASELLTTRQPILLFEINPEMARYAGWQPCDVLDDLRKLAPYQFFLPDGTGGLKPLDETRDLQVLDPGVYYDVFAFVPDNDWHQDRLAPLLGPGETHV